MSEQSVTLAPGQVTTISTGVTAGTTVYNGDATAAVWVSANPTPGPTTGGMRIGPKGSLSWTSGGQLYGAVDPGVTSPVVLTLSSNVNALVNPVDVGAAVAAQLLAQGVPSVFQGDLIASGTSLPATAGTNNYGLLGLDVSRYASLVVTVDTINTAQISATLSAGGGNLGSFDFPVTHSVGAVTFVLPVTGPTLALIVHSVQNVNSYAIYGSNRAVGGPRVLNGYSQNHVQRFNGPYTAGIRWDFDYPFISNGRPVYIRLVVTGGGVGKFGYVGFNTAGTEEIVDLIDSATGAAGTDGSEIERVLHLPPGVLQLYWYPNVSATYTVVAALVQEHY